MTMRRSLELPFPTHSSNAGFIMLSHIIEQATGLQYETVVQQYIFNPLHLNSAGWYEVRSMAARHMF